MTNHHSPFLRTYHLNKHVKSGETEIAILQDINLSIKVGESVAIIGASGSGKTTLLTLLAGLDTPSAGDIYFLHYHLNQLSEEERACLRAQYVGFIFQSFYLLSTLTAIENVMLPLELQYIKPREIKQRATTWLSRVGLDKRLHHYPSQLSGGEQQRVAIARAFVSEPKIIFADEMTGNLDTHTGAHIIDMMFSLNEQYQTTLMLVTHDIQLATRCQRQLLLQEGTLVSV